MPNNYWKNFKMLGQNILLMLMQKLHLPWMLESDQYMGLYPNGGFIYITVFRKQSSGEIIVTRHERIKQDFVDGQSEALGQYIKAQHLSQTPALLILPKEYYDVFMLDDFLKDVSDKRSAVKWRLAEYLDYPCEDAIVDYMALPCKNNSQGKIYALAMRKHILEDCMRWAKKSHIYLQGVDVWQNAIKNSIGSEAQDKGAVIIQIGNQKSELVIMRHNAIYFMRDIAISRKDFSTKNTDAQTEAYELLSLEIQRSIDYCTSHIKNPGIAQVYINSDITDVLDKAPLETILGVTVNCLTLSQWDNSEKVSMPQLIAGSAALGGWL